MSSNSRGEWQRQQMTTQTTTERPIARSLLFVPGHQTARFAKACLSGADTIVLDLEDGVAPQNKDEARAQVARWLDSLGDETRPTLAVRVNAVGTVWHAADVALCAHSRVEALMVPKAEQAEGLGGIAEMLPNMALLPLVETARGMAGLNEIANAPNVQRLVFGTIDFQADLDIEGDGDELLLYRSQMVLTSRLVGLQAPVDGVSTVLDDGARIEADARYARRLGFGGKLCIHPKQVAAVNVSFSPTLDQLHWARRVLAADAASGGSPVAVDGKMVDRPVVLKAQALLRAGSR